MGLYSKIYKTKYLIAKTLGLTHIDRYDSDIVSYTDNFKKQYSGLLNKREGVNNLEAPVILLYSVLPLSYSMQIESLIGRILENLGFRIVILTSYPARVLSDNIHGKIYGFKDILYFQDFLKFTLSEEAKKVIENVKRAGDIEDIKRVKYKNTNVGLHSLASYQGRIPVENLQKDKKFIDGISQIIRQSCLNVDAVENIINLIKPLKVLSVERGDVGNCEIFYETIHRGINYIQWLSCHETNSIMMKRYNNANYRSHPFSISDKTWSEIIKENGDYSDTVLNFFKSGYLKGDWFKYKKLATNKKIIEKDEIIKKLNLDPAKKIAIIFSHILNDANFFYGEDLFKGGFSEWLVRTVQAAGKNNKLNWLLKLHPANVYRRAYSGERGEYGEIGAINESLGDVPSNMKIIPPDIDINPYSFFMMADYGITVRGTVGAELPCFGIPVLTAGTGRYSGKGFTIDSEGIEEYLDRVVNIHKIEPLSDYQRNLAIKHAYLFFKERPAKYDTCIKDAYLYPQGHPIYRDIEIVDRDIFKNHQMLNISRFIAFSKDEDYLTIKRY